MTSEVTTSDATTGSATVSPADRFLPLLVILFVGSGCAALIYEIVWFQLLSLIVGSSAISLGVLLATFMGGMCIGSIALSRVVSASRHPLRDYAYLELGIGAFGLLVLWLLPWVGGLYTSLGAAALLTGPIAGEVIDRWGYTPAFIVIGLMAVAATVLVPARPTVAAAGGPADHVSTLT